jgi:Tfp pilus assembly PilM family ATPase
MAVSVYISNTSIKVVNGKSGKNKITVKDAVRRSIPEGLIINGIITNENGLKDEIKKIWNEYNLPLKDVRLVISGKYVMFKLMKVPNTTPKNILSLIYSEYTGIENIDDFIFDYTVINPENEDKTASVLACATSRENVGQYIDVFESAGIKISSINTALNSAIKLMRNFSSLKNSTYLLAVIDGNMLSPVLFADGYFCFSNRSRLMEERGTSANINEMANIISSFIQFNKAQKNKFDISDVYFCGTNKLENSMCKSISDILGINAGILNECPEIITSYAENFTVSEYIYPVGNLIKL